MAIEFEEFDVNGIRITDHDDDARLRLYAAEAVQVRDELLRRYPLEKAEAPKSAEPAPLSLEGGKWYRRRDGEVVQIVKIRNDLNYPFGCSAGHIYGANGISFLAVDLNRLDLIAEVPAPVKADESNLSPDSIEPVSQEVQDRINLQRDADQARKTELPPSLADAKADGVGLCCESHESARAFKVGHGARRKAGGPSMIVKRIDGDQVICVMGYHPDNFEMVFQADELEAMTREDDLWPKEWPKSRLDEIAAAIDAEKPAWTPPTLEESYASLQRAYEKTDAAFARKCEEYSAEREKRFELETRLNESLASHAKLETKIHNLNKALKALIGE